MTESKKDIYVKLQKYMEKMLTEYSDIEPSVDLQRLKRLFTPKEAEITLKLNLTMQTVEQIYLKVKESDISVEELEQILDKMVEKDVINLLKITGERGEKKYYSIAFLEANKD
ncbi:MAG: hypothetical protein ACFFAN_09475 [Promethearchaeota archaeon]